MFDKVLCRVYGVGCRVSSAECRVQGVESRVSGVGGKVAGACQRRGNVHGANMSDKVRRACGFRNDWVALAS
jgi:hypothetical protein